MGKVEEEGQQQQQQQQQQEQQSLSSSRPSSSERRIAAATPQSQFGGKTDQDERLLLLQETVRSRIVRASPQPLQGLAEHDSTFTAASAASAASAAFLPEASHHSLFDADAVDQADKMILKLHLSGSRSKALKDLTREFFPKAVEVMELEGV